MVNQYTDGKGFAYLNTPIDLANNDLSFTYNLTTPSGGNNPEFAHDFGSTFLLFNSTFEPNYYNYYGTSTVTLSRGAGLLENTSYPGLEGAHAVVSAHRGMYNQPMFLHIDQLQPGDAIFIETHDAVIKYVVTGQLLVLPWQTGVITQDAGLDQLTLLTCDPFPVNDKRLLVNAIRAPITDAEIIAINPALLAPDGDLSTQRTPAQDLPWLFETGIGKAMLERYPIYFAVTLALSVLGLRALLVTIARRRRERRRTPARALAMAD